MPANDQNGLPKLIKRWHPDRYPSGTIEHHDASRMSKAITAAYAAIYHAPLSPDWLRFWTRFAFGALFGSLLGLRYLFYRYVSIPDMTTSVAVTTLFWGMVAGIGDDRIWLSIWRWWWR